jgi:LysM repeat protein
VNMPDLGKQIGPLPLGAWVAVVGGSLGYMFYSRSRGSNDAPIEVAAGPDLGVGLGGMGAVGGYSPTDGGVNAPASPVATIDTNQAWSQQAFNWLVGTGADGGIVDTALRNYLDGRSLSTQQQGLISQALSKFGQTPEGLTAAPEAPGPSVAPGFYKGGAAIYQVYADGSADYLTMGEYMLLGSPPTIELAADSPVWSQLHLVGNKNPFTPTGFGWEAYHTPAPAPAPVTVARPVQNYTPAPAPAPAPPPGRTYTVRPGDNLSRIAAKYWEPWITWQSIYNANRGVIGGNPNLIRPGQVLVIA